MMLNYNLKEMRCETKVTKPTQNEVDVINISFYLTQDGFSKLTWRHAFLLFEVSIKIA
jgi:hypothetical protein